MTTTRAEAIALFRLSTEAGEKVRRNAHKLAWMDATRRMADVVIAMEPQLAWYEAEALAAAHAFADAVMGMSTDEVVSIITEAGGAN